MMTASSTEREGSIPADARAQQGSAPDDSRADSPVTADDQQVRSLDDGPRADGANESAPEFQELAARKPATPGKFELARVGGVQVVLAAELGRTQITIQELMGLSEGSVLELNRSISAPVELVAQGVPLGNGEVVVIDDRFAIRIKEIYQA
jgi:flagellar motor switch protein FliN